MKNERSVSVEAAVFCRKADLRPPRSSLQGRGGGGGDLGNRTPGGGARGPALGTAQRRPVVRLVNGNPGGGEAGLDVKQSLREAHLGEGERVFVGFTLSAEETLSKMNFGRRQH